MKKVLLIAAFAVFGFGISNAQIEQGNSLVTVQAGFAGTYAAGGATASIPLFLNYEYAISDKITIGAFASYATATWDGWFGSDLKWTYIFAGAMGNYHFINDEKLNVYAGARLGYIMVSLDSDVMGADALSSSTVGYAAQVGARYFFTNSIGVNAELGYGFSYVRAGLTFKF